MTLWEDAALMVAPGLRPARYLSIQERYEEWRGTADGQEVYHQVVERAHRLRDRGWAHFGIGALWESIRYDRAVRVGPDALGFKLNDHFRSRMAREVMERERDLSAFFELRSLRA
jgi:hypothetical protein